MTQELLYEILTYDSTTGFFIWNKPVGGPTYAGKAAGRHEDGYIVITYKSKHYRAHRLAWLYIYGELPDGQIDHINHIRDDNAIDNLRVVTHRENSINIKKRKDCTSNQCGVHLYKRTGKWQAYITHNKKRIHLGMYSTKEEATEARKAGETKYGYHQNHGR